jgi:hypothetical protein
LDVFVRQMHRVVLGDVILPLDQCQSQCDLHDEDAQLVVAWSFRNDVNHL